MSRLRRFTALLLSIAYLPACSSYRPSPLAPSEAVAGHDEVEVQVGQGSSAESVRLRHPWIRNDSIGGERRVCTPQRGHSAPWQCEYAPWAMPLAEIGAVKTRQFDGGKVALLAAGVGVVVGAMAIYYYSTPLLSPRYQ